MSQQQPIQYGLYGTHGFGFYDDGKTDTYWWHDCDVIVCVVVVVVVVASDERKTAFLNLFSF